MLRIAVAQTPGTRLEVWRQTLHELCAAIEQAAAGGAELVVLPECAWPAYWIGSRAAFDRAARQGMPADKAFLERISLVARACGLMVCIGYIAREGDRLLNAAALIDADGRRIGRYAKCFLWDFDNDFFTRGGELPVFDTRFGRLAVMICADARLPEIPATLAARGAQVLLQPTAWVAVGPAQRLWNPQPDYLIPSRAAEFGVPIASASKWGREGDTALVGQSLICDAEGRVLARCEPRGTQLIFADVELRPPRPSRLNAAQRAALLSQAPPVLPDPQAPDLSVSLQPAPGSSAASFPPADAQTCAGGGKPGGSVLVRAVPRNGSTAGGAKAAGTLSVRGPFEGVRTLEGACIAAVDASELVSFAPLRIRALAGAHVVMAFGPCETALLRTRATENRLFVVQVSGAHLLAATPTGELLTAHAPPGAHPPTGSDSTPASTCAAPADSAGACAPSPALLLRASLAADKRFARGTDALLGRTPELYEF